MTAQPEEKLPQQGADSQVFYCYYHSQKMLLTLDLTWMLELLTSRFGPSVSIHLWT